jgi:hypothetical protein
MNCRCSVRPFCHCDAINDENHPGHRRGWLARYNPTVICVDVLLLDPGRRIRLRRIVRDP